MLKVGITGGIGSGKTTVCQIFEALGIPVYYADDRAKQLMIENKKVRQAIIDTFGEETYFSDGSLNRAFLASIVFKDATRLAQLNQIVHPAVREDGDQWHQSQVNVPFTLKEAALFFENGSYRFMDKMICVTAPEALRIQRVMARDKVSEKAVLDRINKQLPEAQKIEKSDYIIQNDGTKSIIPQVWRIYKTLSAINKA